MVVRLLDSRLNGMDTFTFLVCKEQLQPVLMTVLSWFGAGVGWLVCLIWFLGGCCLVFAMHNIQDASGTQNEQQVCCLPSCDYFCTCASICI